MKAHFGEPRPAFLHGAAGGHGRALGRRPDVMSQALPETSAFDLSAASFHPYRVVKIRLRTTPPVRVLVDHVAHVVDIRYAGSIARIVAVPEDDRYAPIELSSRPHGQDAWRAWRDGFAVSPNTEARRVVASLLQHGWAIKLAEQATGGSDSTP